MSFDTGKTVQYWKESSEYDLDTGKSLIEAKRFPYALFFGHLALEKLLKALVVENTKEHAPYSHSLPLLAEKSGIEISDELMDKLAEYTEFNIEARYPTGRKEFFQKYTEGFVKKKFKEVEEVYQWFQKKL
jgi:HEPN domain-containing protein